MKVIKRAIRKETARIVCDHCHSVLEYTKEDIKTAAQYNEEEYWIVCPVCNSCVTIDYYNAFPWIDPAGYYEDN